MDDIRYIKLHYTARVMEDTVFPKYKVSALRGGMGDMLINTHCIKDRNCDACEFAGECTVRRTMYSRFDTVKPDFVTEGESIGYLFSCEDYRAEMAEGDTFEFCLTLFGKCIAHFGDFTQALITLGTEGLGKKGMGRFSITEISNSMKKTVYFQPEKGYVNFKILTLEEYVDYRMQKLNYGGGRILVRFRSPLALKYKSEFIDDFYVRPILEAVSRRVYMLDCYEDADIPMREITDDELPVLVDSEVRKVSVRRYSSRQDKANNYSGIEGTAILENVSDDILKLLLAGEITHIGKNTKFGFGRYTVGLI